MNRREFLFGAGGMLAGGVIAVRLGSDFGAIAHVPSPLSEKEPETNLELKQFLAVVDEFINKDSDPDFWNGFLNVAKEKDKVGKHFQASKGTGSESYILNFPKEIVTKDGVMMMSSREAFPSVYVEIYEDDGYFIRIRAKVSKAGKVDNESESGAATSDLPARTPFELFHSATSFIKTSNFQELKDFSSWETSDDRLSIQATIRRPNGDYYFGANQYGRVFIALRENQQRRVDPSWV